MFERGKTMIQVLISTYNGEKYLREQLDSVLAQTVDDISILVRDDGSSDGTVEILEQYRANHSNFSYYRGENIGVTKSFLDLYLHRDSNADYIAMCDQDDVWFEDKLEIAMQMLGDASQPRLYCGKPMLVNENLEPYSRTVFQSQPKIKFGNAMIQNICVGCTMVINRGLTEVIGERFPQECLIHDWWFYMVAVAKGEVVFDSTPHIYYRQHQGNQIGMDGRRIDLIKRQIRSFKRFKGTYTKQLAKFLEIYDLNEDHRALGELFVGTKTSFKCRVRVLFEKQIFRQGKLDTVVFKALMFFGLL